jgi:hypothetical protein
MMDVPGTLLVILVEGDEFGRKPGFEAPPAGGMRGCDKIPSRVVVGWAG